MLMTISAIIALLFVLFGSLVLIFRYKKGLLKIQQPFNILKD
ncbi:MAG: Hypothetical protein AJITA_00704 [Acetilactobacillus jinshanensis]